MMDAEKQLTEKESLDLISEMISRARQSCHSTGITAIMWGLVIVICSLVRLSEIQFGYRLPFDIYLLTFVAVIPQVYFSIQEKKQRRVSTWEDRFMDALWLGFGICIAILIFSMGLVFGKWEPVQNEYQRLTGLPGFPLQEYVPSLYLMLYGMPTFVTGVTMKFKPMLWGGILCWVSAILALFTPTKADLLLLAISAAGAWLIPGIIMEKDYQQAKKQMNRTDV